MGNGSLNLVLVDGTPGVSVLLTVRLNLSIYVIDTLMCKCCSSRNYRGKCYLRLAGVIFKMETVALTTGAMPATIRATGAIGVS